MGFVLTIISTIYYINLTWNKIGACYFACYRLLILLLLLDIEFYVCKVLFIFEKACASWHF